jgi:hypothetical protein
MAYGHAERNLALIRQLEAETRQLLATVTQPDPEQSAWMLEASPEAPRITWHLCPAGSPNQHCGLWLSGTLSALRAILIPTSGSRSALTRARRARRQPRRSLSARPARCAATA